MPTESGLFTTFGSQHRPLSVELDRRTFDEHGLRDRIASLRTVSDVDEFRDSLPELLADIRITAPSLSGLRSADRREGAGKPKPTGQPGLRTDSTRHYVAAHVEGDVFLLQHWPDDVPDVPLPVDTDARQALDEHPDCDELISQLDDAIDTWRIQTITEPHPGEGHRYLIYSYVDLTHAEELALAAGEGHAPREIFRARYEHAAAIAAKIQEQVDRYFDTDLPRRLEDALNVRRRKLEASEAVTATLEFPETWKASPPALVHDPRPTQSSADADSTAAARPLSVPITPRLAPASFADVIRVIRVWADAVERTPRAFSQLSEDEISDLLAATLNATLPGAKREVYTRTGKSDICVTADKLAEGEQPERVFICETKWARDAATVTRGVDPQLFSYLTLHDTAAVLVLLADQKSPREAIDRRIADLKKLDTWVGEDPPMSTWPVLKFNVEKRVVRVCIASVLLPKYGSAV